MARSKEIASLVDNIDSMTHSNTCEDSSDLHIKILLHLRQLRTLLFRRSKRLRVLQSNLIVSDVVIPDEPYPDGMHVGAKPYACHHLLDANAEVPVPFLERVQQVIDKEKSAFSDLSEVYNSINCERLTVASGILQSQGRSTGHSP